MDGMGHDPPKKTPEVSIHGNRNPGGFGSQGNRV